MSGLDGLNHHKDEYERNDRLPFHEKYDHGLNNFNIKNDNGYGTEEQQQQQQQQQQPPSPYSWKERLAANSGNFMEWYDFSVYGYFSDVIGDVFFPSSKLVLSLVIFGAAFFARPAGAIVLGRLGDLHGTKVAIEISILMMGGSSLAMGCLPTYNMIGWIAPALLLLLRFVQGLSVGGQYISTVLYSVEGRTTNQDNNDDDSSNNYAYHMSIVGMFGNFGFFVGNCLSILLRQVLSSQQLHSWGWRIPFWAGTLASLSGFYLRYSTPHNYKNNHIHNTETDMAKKSPTQIEQDDEVKNEKIQWKDMLLHRENLKPLLCFVGVLSVGGVSFYLVFTWMAIWMDHLLVPPIHYAYGISAISFFISCVLFSPLGGIFVDRSEEEIDALLFSTFGLTALLFPLFLLAIPRLQANHTETYITLMAIGMLAILGILISIMLPAVPFYFLYKFPESTKVTTMNLSYNLSLAIFGGMSPALSTAIFKLDPLAPGYYVVATAILSIISLYFAKDLPSYRPARNHDNDDSNVTEPIDNFVEVPFESTSGSLSSLSAPLLMEDVRSKLSKK